VAAAFPCAASTASAATTPNTPWKWASPAASRRSSSSSRPTRWWRCPPGETGEIDYPSLTANLHHEIELVVAIGTGGRNIKAADAARHIWGYAVGLDMTRRDLQNDMKKQGRPWCIGKAFEQSAPIGPIVPIGTTGELTTGAITLT
jgi:2-keto-4-pentenoate hydratase/2-oxohepta-3-ene-1,7-dioic acid hydratase in catechol pathway